MLWWALSFLDQSLALVQLFFFILDQFHLKLQELCSWNESLLFQLHFSPFQVCIIDFDGPFQAFGRVLSQLKVICKFMEFDLLHIPYPHFLSTLKTLFDAFLE